MNQSQSPVHSHPVRVTKSQCKSARRRAVQETPMTRVKRPLLDVSALINELCERDVPEIDWEKLALDHSSVYWTETG